MIRPYEPPTQEELAEAIDTANGALIAQYAVAVQLHRNRLADDLPAKIEAAANAKRDLDTAKAAMKNCDEIVKLCQSVLRSIRPI